MSRVEMCRQYCVCMPGNTVEIVRRGVELFNARDIDRLIELFDPEIELHSAFAAAMSGAVYRGHTGLRDWHRDLDETWAEIRLDPERFFERGERVLAHYLMHGRGRQSGVKVTMPVAHVMTFRHDHIVYLRTYADRDAALLDFGDTEDALEQPIS